MAFSYPATDAVAAQQDPKTHGLPNYVTDHAETPACRDYRASDGNVTKLEEPDRNLPTRAAPGEAALEGACSRRRIRAEGAGKCPDFGAYSEGKRGLCDARYVSSELHELRTAV